MSLKKINFKTCYQSVWFKICLLEVISSSFVVLSYDSYFLLIPLERRVYFYSEILQVGQMSLCCLHHSSMQFVWKIWPQVSFLILSLTT